MNYELAYRIGFHPWEDAERQLGFVERLSELLADEESGYHPPHGAVLDIGTGSGIWAVRLAERGWQVTAVDIVGKALERARARARERGADVQLVQADVTALRAAGVTGPFRLLLDTGTFHGLDKAERITAGRELSAVADPAATILMLAWAPRRRGPLPRGASHSEVAAAFPDWEVTDLGPTEFQAPKPVELLMRPGERWYRLRRR